MYEFVICIRLNICLCIDGFIFFCNNIVIGVLKYGIVILIKKLNIKYIINIGVILSLIISSLYNV